MDSEIKGNSLDQLIGYYEHSSAESQISILKESYGLSDFNNVETADRKLIINNKLEFWVHDFVLNTYCDYFRVNLETERLKKNPYYQKNNINQNNNILIKDFNIFDEESSKRNKTEETNINNTITTNINNNNTINTNNSINNNIYSKFIFKNNTQNNKYKKISKEQKEQPKEIKEKKDEINNSKSITNIAINRDNNETRKKKSK